jgi:hypothetical protein
VTCVDLAPSRRGFGYDDALVVVHGQQHAGCVLLWWRDRHNPRVTEMLSEKPLLYGARRIYRKDASQCVRSFGAARIDGRYVQDGHQPSVNAEDRRAGATQVHMSRSEVLASVDGDGPLFGDAGSDTVRALDLLGPDAAEPGSPVFELARLRTLAAMLDGHTRGVTEQNWAATRARPEEKPRKNDAGLVSPVTAYGGRSC